LRKATVQWCGDAIGSLAPGERVVVAAADPLEALLGVLACWHHGLVAVCVNPALTAPEQEKASMASA
jgi:acyl-CoA synthetase (AMP-forming)/AMP-acid ligase II